MFEDEGKKRVGVSRKGTDEEREEVNLKEAEMEGKWRKWRLPRRVLLATSLSKEDDVEAPDRRQRGKRKV